MAHHKSSKKRIKSDEAKRQVNKSRLSTIRTFIKKVEAAIIGGDKTVAKEALKNAESKLAKGASKGVMPKKTASRKTSRLAAQVKKMK
ncbi:MAG: 30S ribosomal protein S20 [Alphaproteobacteria bacterium]|jgi:small subunit ribosomal protein S20|nr:30S ribosomal protein S20 [Alphaproteobacteria bacterium]